jgi:hypothetical protein
MMPLLRIVVFSMLAAFGTVALAAQEKNGEPAELTQIEIERRVKDDVARRGSLRADDVRIIESRARVWPDAGLGCNARRGVFEPAQVPGFEIVAEAGGRRSVYHTDHRGRLLRCSTPRKPIDRIQ